MQGDCLTIAEARAYAHLIKQGLIAPELATAYRTQTPKGVSAIVAIVCANGSEREQFFTAQDVYAYIENQAFLRYLNTSIGELEATRGKHG